MGIDTRNLFGSNEKKNRNMRFFRVYTCGGKTELRHRHVYYTSIPGQGFSQALRFTYKYSNNNNNNNSNKNNRNTIIVEIRKKKS
jgi:hypothetical protein